ncbi:MAG TPA: type VI secretion system protein TssA [Bryobacteraceae bacterium]|nr:type VI secretion system protein TssA [Bryobacteraceae bacterium]
MPLRDDLLKPISESNPGGENLRYAPVYDKIKEARRQDDDAPQGEWQRERKVADYALVTKLAGDALATKSKDLQLAAWLTEALLQRESIGGMLAGLNLIRGLIENFWDTLYPEIEDGESELRAAPVEWVGMRLDIAVREAPLTRSGYGLLKYKESRTVGYEEAAAESEAKAEARAAAIAEGKLTPEEFDKALASTPKAFYEQLVSDLDSCLQVIEELQTLCEEKFGEFNPSFSRLREALEEVRHTANSFLQKKREADPDPIEDATVPEEEAAPAVEEAPVETVRRAAAPRKTTSAEPVDREDAIQRVVGAAAFLRREDPYNPAPYLLLRALRWGELRASGSVPDPNLLEPPPTQTRQQLRRLANEGSWNDLLEAAEAAMALPCGRAWLDLQRHVVRACEEQSTYYDPIANAIKSELRVLLQDIPSLLSATLTDDTPAANAETQAWLQELTAAGRSEARHPAPTMDLSEPGEESSEAVIDSFALAMEAARSGRAQEGIEILAGEIARQNSGRGRFQRKLQLAQLCISIGHEPIAKSILEELARTIERHQLEEWEAADVVAHALGMLYACMQKLDGDPVEKQKLYARICRLDPMQALVVSR